MNYFKDDDFNTIAAEVLEGSVGTFERCFLDLGLSKRSFTLSCPVVATDGINFLCKHRGVLLRATVLDENHLFPLASAVANGENESNWTWSLNNFRQFVGKTPQFTSDRADGLIKAVTDVFPESDHVL
ncbi:hypothetical protein RCL1_008072 [Eukaryota sp. TZLM3-RCL]